VPLNRQCTEASESAIRMSVPLGIPSGFLIVTMSSIIRTSTLFDV